MIIPKISAARFNNDESGQANLIQTLTRWSLFGVVALADIEDWPLLRLESIAQSLGGSVDLEIELKQPDETIALAVLNSGATTILCPDIGAEQLSSIPSERLRKLKLAAADGLTAGDQVFLQQPSAEKIAQFEQKRVDAVIDSEWLETNPSVIADFFQKILISDRPDGLWATLIVDQLGLALGLAYSNYESLLDAITHRRGTYWSRSRGELWVKGATSGATQDLIGLRIDCDRDCLRFMVTQGSPGFCHRNTHSCFGHERTIQSVIDRLSERIASTDEKSFTKILVNDPDMLRKKLLEEAQELSEAAAPEHIAFEAADVLYFSLVKMLSAGVTLDQVHHELARRMNRVVRRKNKLEERT